MSSSKMPYNGSLLAKVWHLKNLGQTFAEKPNRITNVAYRTVCPTIANTMLAVFLLLLLSSTLLFLALYYLQRVFYCNSTTTSFFRLKTS